MTFVYYSPSPDHSVRLSVCSVPQPNSRKEQEAQNWQDESQSNEYDYLEVKS